MSRSEEYKRLQEIIKNKKIVSHIKAAGIDPTVIGGVTIECLNPPGPISRGEEATFTETNDSSLVMRMTYGEISFLFPADISFLTEERLAYSSRQLRSQLLFVPHHGGRTSSSEAFLQRLRPQVAIISVGADNLARLPHPDVLNRLNRQGVLIYRTDLHGAVTASTDGRELSLYPYRTSAGETVSRLGNQFE